MIAGVLVILFALQLKETIVNFRVEVLVFDSVLMFRYFLHNLTILL
jgi:hypothetical protein